MIDPRDLAPLFPGQGWSDIVSLAEILNREETMSKLTEEELYDRAQIFANDLAAMLNRAREDGLLVSLDTNEYDSYSVGCPVAGGKLSRWITVARSNDGNGEYEVKL